LEIATTVKLTRALWIIPVALLFAFLEKLKATEKSEAKLKKPWFILGFLLMAAAVTYVPIVKIPGTWVYWGAKRLLVLTLFLIGSNVPRTAIKEVGVKPLILGITLWGLVTVSTLSAILAGWVH
ncbi:MAG: putative sulfate exporter family transporter, partial [Deltaproteobacteria bacterium]